MLYSKSSTDCLKLHTSQVILTQYKTARERLNTTIYDMYCILSSESQSKILISCDKNPSTSPDLRLVVAAPACPAMSEVVFLSPRAGSAAPSSAWVRGTELALVETSRRSGWSSLRLRRSRLRLGSLKLRPFSRPIRLWDTTSSKRSRCFLGMKILANMLNTKYTLRDAQWRRAHKDTSALQSQAQSEKFWGEEESRQACCRVPRGEQSQSIRIHRQIERFTSKQSTTEVFTVIVAQQPN